MFKSVLVANRGEIACRVFRTARRIAHARVSDEGQEGVRAYLEKRKPNWAE